jgi:hypothetical protein
MASSTKVGGFAPVWDSKNRSSIFREIFRNRIHGYNAGEAHALSQARRIKETAALFVIEKNGSLHE